MIVSLGAGVLKHLPGQHDQSTHGSGAGSGAGSGSPKLTIIGKNDGLNKHFNESTRVVRFQPEGKEPKDYVLYADGADAVLAYEKPTDGTTIDGYSSFAPDKRIVGHLEIARPGQGTAWRRSAENDKKATVIEAVVRSAHQRRGLASAMLRFHRDLYPELETVHSDAHALTDQGKAWSDVAKHLPGQHDQSSHGRKGGGQASWQHYEDTYADNIAVSDVFVKEFGQGTLVVAFEDSDPEFGLDPEGQKRVMQWIEETQAVAPIVGEPFMPSQALMEQSPINMLMAGDARNVMVVVDDSGFEDVPEGAMGYTAVTRHGAMRDTVIHIRQEFLVRAQGETIARSGLNPSAFMPTGRTSPAGKYVITHEWGHAHDLNDDSTSNKHWLDIDDLPDSGGMSQYGQSDPREAYAEAFTQHFLPTDFTNVVTTGRIRSVSALQSKRNLATEKYAEWNLWGAVAKGLAPKGKLVYPADMLTMVIYDTFKDAPIIKRDVPYGVHPTPVAKHGDPSRANYASQHPNSRGGGFARNLTAIRSGRKVTVNAEDVEPMLELMSQGSDQPNLTLLSVKGMEGKTFDTENLGLDRSQMPQVPSQLKAKFIADMEAQGVGMKRSERNPIGLKPIQGEISGRSAGFIMQNEKKDRKVTDAARVLVTRDGWILDGHHRWAGSVALELAGHGHSLPVLILDQDLGFAMDTVRKWGEANGVQSLDLGERNKKSDLSKTLVTFGAGVLKHGDPSRPNYAAQHPNSPALSANTLGSDPTRDDSGTLNTLLKHSLAPNASDIPADEDLIAQLAKDKVATDIENGMSDVSTQDLASACLGDQYGVWAKEQKLSQYPNGFLASDAHLLPPQDGDYTENEDGEFFDSGGEKFNPATPANLTVFFAEDGSLKPDAPEFTIEQDGSLMAVVPDMFEDSFSPRTPEGEKALRKACVGRLVKNWALTSNDSDATSLAMQMAAKKEFALVDAEEWTGSDWEPDKVNALFAKHGSVYQKFLRVQYNNTQSFLKEHNIEDVSVFRGRKEKFPQGSNQRITMRPLSSWSYGMTSAKQFAGVSGDGGWYGTVFHTTVPRRNILSLPTTGIGCFAETEIVLIGEPVTGSIL